MRNRKCGSGFGVPEWESSETEIEKRETGRSESEREKAVEKKERENLGSREKREM